MNLGHRSNKSVAPLAARVLPEKEPELAVADRTLWSHLLLQSIHSFHSPSEDQPMATDRDRCMRRAVLDLM
jgi:hypothetical protein